MAATKSKSLLSSKYGAKAKQAFESHKNDETNFGNGGDVPAGVENGIAQLTDIKIGTYENGENAGELYFYAAGICVAPKAVSIEGDLIPVEGLRTSIIEPLHDTPDRSRKTFDEHFAWVLNEVRKLGLDTSSVDFDSFEDNLQALKEAAPMFRFRTWASKPTEQYPTPRTNHTWGGAVDYEGSSEDAVAEEGAPKTTKSSGKTSTKKASKLDPSLADSGDEAAMLAIAEAAKAVGIDPEDASYANWQAVYDAIEETKKAPSKSTGELADEGDETAVATLNAECEAAGIDANSYGTWVEVEAALAEVSGTEATEEVTEETVEDSGIAGMGELADGGDEAAIAKLNEACEAAGIDPNEYGTWVEVEGALTPEAQEFEEVDPPEAQDENSITGLGALADGGDEDSINKLNVACEAAGIDPNSYGTWEEVEAALGENTVVVPQAGEVYLYTPAGAKKAIECEVVSVQEDAQTVTLKDNATKKLYPKVAFSAILA